LIGFSVCKVIGAISGLGLVRLRIKRGEKITLSKAIGCQLKTGGSLNMEDLLYPLLSWKHKRPELKITGGRGCPGYVTEIQREYKLGA